MWMIIEKESFPLTIINNKTSQALMALLPLSLDMLELNNNEKYATLSANLPIDPIRPKIIRDGDLMLFGSNTLVLFYKTFTSSYAYTPIGRIKNNVALADIVGNRRKHIQFIKVNN